MGRLQQLEVENFKSYAGHQVIGPFSSFQAVIGPNGAGKSNLMDAISFVLGVKSRHLRSTKLGDLVFRADGAAVARRRAYVKLVYQVDEGEVDGMQAGAEIVFMRTIAATGVGSYRINNSEVTWEKYDSKLREIGVLTNARNFLVFQGDVESVASKSPKELTTLIEQISGSEEHKAQYEECQKLKDVAEENTIFSFQKKKSNLVEKKQLKEQKDEAERFNAKVAQLADTKCEFFLWQLFHIHKNIGEHQDEIAEMQSELEERKRSEADAEATLKTAKKEHAKRNRACTEIEKTTAKQRGELAKLEPERVKQSAEIKNLEKKMKDDTRSANRVEKDQQEQAERIEGIEQDVEKLQAAEASQEKAAREARDNSGVQLDETKAEEYEALKERARTETAADKSTLETLQRQHKADEQALVQLESEHAGFQQQLNRGEEVLSELNARMQSMAEATEKTRRDFAEADDQMKEMQSKARQDAKRRTALEGELEEVQKQLRDARDHRRQTKNEEKMSECLATLKRLFPGVKGRLIDLCKPVQRRYNRAVAVAAGRHMDAIVVDTQGTGYECIQYMREHRIGVASFIPLNGIKTKEVNERLRSLDDNCRLCIDVIQCAPEVKPAVMYAVENTVVCETLDVARDLCFRRREQVKAVTLEGAVISKSGTMTGGNTAKDADRADRWDEQAHQELKARKEALTAALDELGRPARQHGAENELQTKMTNLRNKENYTLKDLEVTKQKIAGHRKQEKQLAKEIARVGKERARLEPSVAERSSRISELQRSIADAEEAIFRGFSESVGVTNLLEFEEGQLKATKEASETRRKLREHRAKLEAQLQYERTRDFTSPLNKIRKRMAQTEARLGKVQEKQQALADREAALKTDLEQSEAALADAKAALAESDAEIKQIQAERSEAVKERGALSRRITAEETSVDQLRSKLQNVMQKAKVEEVDLPMTDGESAETTQPGEGEEASGSGSQDKTVQDEVDRVDYSRLERHRELKDQKHYEEVRREYESGIADLHAELETMQPNMKAVERFDDVSSKYKSSAEEFEKAKEDARAATAAFNEVKQKRHDAFMACFQHVSQELRSIYQDMTKSSKHPLGGNAYLSLDDTEEPYLGGIKYNAMPPMKRFRDMEQLSGGEKTVAALAFLFSIHSFRPAPFFVMDEVDAALDNVNVKKVCNYIKQRSHEFQCIVISLKDIFYEQADSLVGICRDAGTNSSRTLTLDLSQFDDDAAGVAP